MYPLVAPAAQYIPPTSSFFYLFYEISVVQSYKVPMIVVYISGIVNITNLQVSMTLES